MRPIRTNEQLIQLTDKQAAQLFRSLVKQGACQCEGGRMRWWLEAGLILTLTTENEWTLSVQAERNCFVE